MTVKCLTCSNRITEPHYWNNYDLWCAKCHAKARRGKLPDVKETFLRRVSRDGHLKRGNY